MAYVCRSCDVSRIFKARKLFVRHNCGPNHKRKIRILNEHEMKKGFIVKDETGTIDRKKIVSYLEQFGDIISLTFAESAKETTLKVVFRDKLSSEIFYGKLAHIVEKGKPMLRVSRYDCEHDTVKRLSESKELLRNQLKKIFEDKPRSQTEAAVAGNATASGNKPQTSSVADFALESCSKLKSYNLVSELIQFLLQDLIPSTRTEGEQEAIDCLVNMLTPKYSDVTLEVFGSSSYQLGFYDRGVDVSAFGLKDDQLKEVIETFQTQKTSFENLKVCAPWLTFEYKPKQINVKMIISRKSVLTMSQIMAYVLDVDPRVRQLIMIIRYWARVQKVYSSKKGNAHLGSHALTMMIIFYMQQKNILPPIFKLQNSAFENDLITWCVHINQRYRHEHQNTSSIAEIFAGFFSFYAEFDFDNQVICPFLGHAVPRQLFRQVSTLPNEFTRLATRCILGNSQGLPVHYFITICIQDPVNHDDNLSANVSSENFYTLREFICTAAKICMHSPPEAWITRLFSEDFPLVCREASPLFAVVKLSPYTGESVGNPFTWLTRRMRMLLEIFEIILKLKVIRIEYTNGDMCQNTEVVENRTKILCSTKQPTITWLCEGKVDVMRNRDTAAASFGQRIPDLFHKSAPPLAQQLVVSDLIIRSKKIDAKSNPRLRIQPQIALKFGINIDVRNFRRPTLFLDVQNRHSTMHPADRWKNFFLLQLPGLLEGAIAYENTTLGPQLNLAQYTCPGCGWCRNSDLTSGEDSSSTDLSQSSVCSNQSATLTQIEDSAENSCPTNPTVPPNLGSVESHVCEKQMKDAP